MFDTDYPSLQKVKEFTTEFIRPFSKEMDENEKLKQGLILELASNGYLSSTFPKEYGGLEMDPIEYGLLIEEIGKACCSTRALITVQTSLIGESLLRYGTEEQKKEYLSQIAIGKKIGAFALTEPSTGSDAHNIQTQYVPVGNKYVINGKKKWISFAGIADFFIVIAACNGKTTAFIVDSQTKGITIQRMKGLLASKATYVAQIDFENVCVPKENIIGSEGGGFLFVASTALDHGRYSIAWGGVAIAQEALESSLNYVRGREQFNKKLYEHQMVQGMIGDMVTNIKVARAYCLRVGELRKRNEPDVIFETNMAKYFTSQVAMLTSNYAVQIHGGNGCYNHYPVERLYREAKILEIIEGSSQIQQQIAAKYALNTF